MTPADENPCASSSIPVAWAATRAEAREAAEGLRVQAGEVDVLTALVAADRERLAALLTERQTAWFERISGLLRKAA